MSVWAYYYVYTHRPLKPPGVFNTGEIERWTEDPTSPSNQANLKLLLLSEAFLIIRGFAAFSVILPEA